MDDTRHDFIVGPFEKRGNVGSWQVFSRWTNFIRGGRQQTLIRQAGSATGISAQIVEDSLAPNGKRITTFVLKYPRFIHAEYMTHRLFSRNAASSRAIPVKKIRAKVFSNPAGPIFWGKNKAGMSADEELRGWRLYAAKLLWHTAAKVMVGFAYLLDLVGLHKQIANRILEPWFTITVVCTATDFGNFFNLRCDSAAQPEIHHLADIMFAAYRLNKPKELEVNGWHLPFVTADERETLPVDALIRCSVARCARTSYENHDQSNPSPEKDTELYQKLLSSFHVSPLEHQATPADTAEECSGNFKGWHQLRKSIPGEYRPEFKQEHT